LERWASFYQDRYDDQNSHNEINIPSITYEEIQAAIKNLKQAKVQALTVPTQNS